MYGEVLSGIPLAYHPVGQINKHMITIPEEFVTSTIKREGKAGHSWISDLPNLIKRIIEQWDLEIDGTAMHGYLGLAIPVVRRSIPYLLKVSWIDETTKNEAIALSVWSGNGAVKLHEVQHEIGAMLLERLNPKKTLNQIEITEAITIAGKILKRLAVPDPGSLPKLNKMSLDIANSLSDRWDKTGRVLPEKFIESAYEFAIKLGKNARQSIVNYDLHYLDILAGKREPWLAIDPKVVIGDPEFGVAQLLWCRLEDIQESVGLETCFKILVNSAHLDDELTRAWTIVRCVDYWLWGVSIGLTEDPARCENILNWLL